MDGTLTVSKAPLTIRTGGGSKAYDGTAITNDEAEIIGLVGNETATVSATGSQIEIGSSENGYTVSWESAKEGNYDITSELGQLTITANDIPITLTAAWYGSSRNRTDAAWRSRRSTRTRSYTTS